MEKILLAIDGSDSCNKAIRWVAELAEKIEVDVTIVTVVEDHVSLQVDTKAEVKKRMAKKDAIVKKAEKTADACLERLSDATRNINKIVEEGTPSDVICRIAAKDDYDLVVVADMGRNAVKKFLLGSTTERVVRHCNKSVLVVK